MIYQDVRENALQAYIKYKAYYDKKANASKLQKAEYVYFLQPKVDHQGSKIPFTEFRWIEPYIIEEVLPNNNYSVRIVGTNKTQMLHGMRLRQITPGQPLTGVQITPQEWKSDPEVSIKHDYLYARAWECDYERPIFDADDDNTAPLDPPEIVVRSDLPPEEM